MGKIKEEYERAKLSLREDEPERAFIQMKISESVAELSQLGMFAERRGIYDTQSPEYEAMYEAMIHLSRLVNGIETGEIPPAEDYRL